MRSVRRHGFYCSSCGARHGRLPDGLVNCRQCGGIGLRAYALVPRRVKCRADGCTFTGWHDGGVNDDMGDHFRNAHTEDRQRVVDLQRALDEIASAIRPFLAAYPIHPDPLTPGVLASVPTGTVTVDQVRKARRAMGYNP